MGQEEVPGHVEAGGDGRAEQEGGGLEQGGAETASINLRKNLDGTYPQQNARTGHSSRQFDANRLSRRRAEGAYRAVFCWLSAAISSWKPNCRRN